MARILIVEDNPANMKLAMFLLERGGHTVLTSIDAAGGIAQARAEHPDLILMDINLPDMDGLQATRILKDDPKTKNIPVVALTAVPMEGDAEKWRAAGCDSYIDKGALYKELWDAIEKQLGQHL
jgi:two-component system cell cycle response regulator DivK